MSSEEIVISARNLGKTYRLFGHPGDRIKQFILLGLKQYHTEFAALQDISFDVRRGEMVGIIGRNGSGKSTLLQLLCGILKPTTGTVKVNGRISALLELGAGFNPEFTGRENVYFQGAITGASKEEMNLCFDDILAFADIGEFIDHPVRMYSSGMFVRLAFAVAVNLKPDVLVVDEALSVGDERFQRKVMACVENLKKNGTTILLVSHSSSVVARLCEKTILLDKGVLQEFSDAKNGIRKYHDLLYSNMGCGDVTSGQGGAITRVIVQSEGGLSTSVFQSGEFVDLFVEVDFYDDVPDVQVGISIVSMNGCTVFGTNTSLFAKNVAYARAGEKLIACFRVQLNLCEGGYFVSCACASAEPSYGSDYIDRRQEAVSITVINRQRVATGVANLPVSVSVSISDK